MLDGYLDRMKQPIKIDISTGDLITPAAIEYSYPLMFEERTVNILSYNLETVLGEKMETILSRAEANTRMRDYYDIYVLLNTKRENIQNDILRSAFDATCRKRKSNVTTMHASEILSAVKGSEIIKKHWENYRKGNYYVGNLEWDEVCSGIEELAEILQIM